MVTIKIPNGIDHEGKPTFQEIEGEVEIKNGEIFFKKKVDPETHNFNTSLANAWRAEDDSIDEELAKKEIEKYIRNWDKVIEALKFYADMHHLYENEWAPYCYIIQDESPDRDKPDFAELEDGGMVENGYKARKVLEEISEN